ncbi:unnamed protein product [Prorocentrum cordatum]|uniref:C3H1-type domain-containing protein n=1 Tax=Prorocentrum cordatum TaxID=2364126 RepID=A0ABN9UMP6_9DINO|nr:unnamed protein product [Polarella glacialis]
MSELQPRLAQLLQKHGVDEKVVSYLKANSMVSVMQFAGLADSKTDVGEGVCTPSGLDPADRPLCQPVKAAWQEAEALVASELEIIRKGIGGDWDDPIDPEVRTKKTRSFVQYYQIKLPSHLIGSDALAERLVREHERKTPTAHDLHKIRALNSEPGAEKTVGVSIEHRTAVGADDVSTFTAHASIHKHRVLMNTLALAAAPEWAAADWSVLLDYHEWVVLRLFERKKGGVPPVEAVVRAGHSMRSRWAEAIRNDSETLAQAVLSCRTERVSLFAELHSDRAEGDSGRPQEPAAKKARGALQRVTHLHGKELRKFYNAGTCTYGKRCRFKHACNVKGCGGERAACDRHEAA